MKKKATADTGSTEAGVTDHKAVIDRIEDGTWAVLLIGQEQTEKIIPVEQLPQDAKAGTWLRLRLEEDVIREIVVDAEETTAIRSRVASKLDKLRSRQRRFTPVAVPVDNAAVDSASAEAGPADVAPTEARAEPTPPPAPVVVDEPEKPTLADGQNLSHSVQDEDFIDFEGYE